MRPTLVLAGLAALASSARADTVFHSWMVAPEVVQAGDSFTVEVWVSMETTDFDPNGTLFGWATLSVAFGGDIGLIEQATEAYGSLIAPGLNGDVTSGGILDIMPWQPGHPWVWTIDDSNPVLMFRFDVTPADGRRGILMFDDAPASAYSQVHFGWFLDPETWFEEAVSTLETPNTHYQAEGVTVRVIPAPASLGAWAVAGLAIRRRR
ncbi:MAG: hypothetical protein Kow0022_05040 [Phycisphaerales bacterium]